METEKNKKLYWCSVLHMYQPPTQSKEILDNVANESYKLIVSLLEKHKNLRLTLNFSGSLLELLDVYGYSEIIKRIQALVESGQIELVGSAAYHPILPLLPKSEIERQIDLNNQISKKYFGESYKPKGFYLPELAYSKETAEIIESKGFEWIFLDNMHFPEDQKPNPEKIYRIDGLKLRVVFRDIYFSKSFPPESITVERNKIENDFIVTVHDAELYGHWHKDDRGFFEKIFSDNSIQTVTTSEYFKILEDRKAEELKISPRNASWESTKTELEENIPFALWDNPKNIIHNKMNTLRKKALDIVTNSLSDKNYEISRKFLDRGFVSCAWWWANERRLGPFSPETWNPTEIEKGAREILASVRSLKSVDKELKIEMENIFSDLINTIWNHHWKKESDRKE